MLPIKHKRLKKAIIDYLKEKSIFDKIDSMLIEELIFNKYMCDEAKKSIVKYGILVNVVRDEKKDPLYQTNQAVNVYQQAVKNVNAIAVKLGLNPQERVKLQLTSSKQADELDNLLD